MDSVKFISQHLRKVISLVITDCTGTWCRGRRLRRYNGFLSFSNHANPVLVGITVQVVPPGRPVFSGHHLHTVFSAIVIIGFTVAPVRVADRRPVAPVVTLEKRG